MPVFKQILEQQPLIQGMRRHIHSAPELGYEVHETAAFVQRALESWGILVTSGIGQTGLVGTLQRGASQRAIGLRADMDALPMQEENDFSHRSKTPNAMHACGHDGHTAMLLGAAQYLASHGEFDGRVHFIFQPAEEGGAGAKAMIDDGLFEIFPVDSVFGLHNWPGLPEGHIAFRSGPLMASSNRFTIKISGSSCHAARPHTGNDPLLAASHLVTSLQAIVSRNVAPTDNAVVSICQFHAGSADNIISDEAVISGTVRRRCGIQSVIRIPLFGHWCRAGTGPPCNRINH